MAFTPQPNAYNFETSVLGGRMVSIQFTAGTSGAAPASLTHGAPYVSSVTKNTNDYVFALRQKWFRFIPFNITVRQASFSTTGAFSGTVTVDNSSGSSPSFTVDFYRQDTGAAVALGTGDIVNINIELANEKI